MEKKKLIIILGILAVLVTSVIIYFFIKNNYKNLKTTYYNSSVIGDIVDKYLKGDISKDKFIRQLSAATEIYLTE